LCFTDWKKGLRVSTFLLIQDKKADLVIRAKLDFVMEELANHLKLVVPPYSPEIDPTHRLIRQGDDDEIMDWSVPRK